MICSDFVQCAEQQEPIGCHKAVDKSCLEYCDQRKVCTCSERKKTYTLTNDLEFTVSKYHIDGGLVCDEQNTRRCDYMFVCRDNLQRILQIFIELKGTDVIHAMEQLDSSISMLRLPIGDGKKAKVRAVCVCESVPNIQNDPRGYSIRKNFMKNGIDFVPMSRKANEKISKIWCY